VSSFKHVLKIQSILWNTPITAFKRKSKGGEGKGQVFLEPSQKRCGLPIR